jgi:hypothetical protein
VVWLLRMHIFLWVMSPVWVLLMLMLLLRLEMRGGGRKREIIHFHFKNEIQLATVPERI